MKIDNDTDPHFSSLLSLKLRWNAVLDIIKRFYPLTSGELLSTTTSSTSSNGSLRLILLFVPNAVMDYCMLIEYSNSNNNCHDDNDAGDKKDDIINVYACSKHQRQQVGELDLVERTFLGNLSTTISYHLWKCTR